MYACDKLIFEWTVTKCLFLWYTHVHTHTQKHTHLHLLSSWNTNRLHAELCDQLNHSLTELWTAHPSRVPYSFQLSHQWHLSQREHWAHSFLGPIWDFIHLSPAFSSSFCWGTANFQSRRRGKTTWQLHLQMGTCVWSSAVLGLEKEMQHQKGYFRLQ